MLSPNLEVGGKIAVCPLVDIKLLVSALVPLNPLFVIDLGKSLGCWFSKTESATLEFTFCTILIGFCKKNLLKFKK